MEEWNNQTEVHVRQAPYKQKDAVFQNPGIRSQSCSVMNELSFCDKNSVI